MKFRILLAAVLTAALTGGVVAQTDKHVHEHGSVNAEPRAAAGESSGFTLKLPVRHAAYSPSALAGER